MDGEVSIEALVDVVRSSTGDGGITVRALARLSGGASRETWAFDAVRSDGTVDELILRRDPPGAVRVVPGGMGLEARALAAAAGVGVPVPRVLAGSDDLSVLGAPFIVMERLAGETIPRKILRDDAYAGARPRLAGQCGTILARLHRLSPDDVGDLEEQDQLSRYREVLDELAQPHPALELGFRWLQDNRPPVSRRTVVHGDFRNGNLIVDPGGVRAVLDWELVHAGDPIEDLAWLCVKAWRFGVDLPVGGFGTYDQLTGAYEAESGTRVDRDAMRWWEVLGTLKWGVMCIVQAASHTSGMVRSVELAAIGRRVCENEWDVLDLLPAPFSGQPADGGPSRRMSLSAPAAGGPGASPAESLVAEAGPHDMPGAAELVEAVREFLERDVMETTAGRVRFHTRVAINVLAIVERELAARSEHAARHAAGLAAVGVTSETGLAAAIRAGSLDDRLAEVAAFVRATVRDKLEVAHPGYVG